MRTNIGFTDIFPLLLAWGLTFQNEAIYFIGYWSTFVWCVLGMVAGVVASILLLSAPLATVKRYTQGSVDFLKILLWSGVLAIVLYAQENTLAYMMIFNILLVNATPKLIRQYKHYELEKESN